MTLGTACGDASSARPGAVVDAVKRVTRPHPKSKTPSPKTSSSVFKSTEPERRLGSGIYSMDLPQTLVLKPRALVDAERMSAADRVRRISVSVRMHVATKRSEERRVGKECRSVGSWCREKTTGGATSAVR